MFGNLDKGRNSSEKISFSKNVKKFFSKEEKIYLIVLKVIYFQ